jgi:hypothetical protein
MFHAQKGAIGIYRLANSGPHFVTPGPLPVESKSVTLSAVSNSHLEMNSPGEARPVQPQMPLEMARREARRPISKGRLGRLGLQNDSFSLLRGPLGLLGPIGRANWHYWASSPNSCQIGPFPMALGRGPI